MSVASGSRPTLGSIFVHQLPRARDWQHRPQFDELCQWWKDGGMGVCALVGTGGAGKTAIAERFLQVLLGGSPEHPKNPELVPPSRLFVFSFYDNRNPDSFFSALAAWLEDSPTAPLGDTLTEGVSRLSSYPRSLLLLASAGSCLLVLDGLEQVQDDGSLGGGPFGHILDAHLRDLVLRAADGKSRLSLLITSRSRLYDPLELRTRYFRQIEVEQLQQSAAAQLLRDRGVIGTDEELEHLAHEAGHHALAVDLVGAYIAEFCDGNPQLYSPLTPERTEPIERSDPTLDPRIADIGEQALRFTRVIGSYHHILANRDPAALALLQRVCLFHLGVDAETLVSLFTGEGRESISGSALAQLNEEQLRAKLTILVDMGLIESKKAALGAISISALQAPSSPFYTVHPVVREGFLKELDAETTRLGHEAVRQGLEESLKRQQSATPIDSARLELFEEMIFHTLQAGRPQDAWDIYWFHVGGYAILGWMLSDFERGERICRLFGSAQGPTSAELPPSFTLIEASLLFSEWHLYLMGLGRRVEAIHCYERYRLSDPRIPLWDKEVREKLSAVISKVRVGRLREARRLAQEAVTFAARLPRKSNEATALVFLAYVEVLLGNVSKTNQYITTIVQLQNTAIPASEPPVDPESTLLLAMVYLRVGNTALSEELVLKADNSCRATSGLIRHGLFMRCQLVLAAICLRRRDFGAFVEKWNLIEPSLRSGLNDDLIPYSEMLSVQSKIPVILHMLEAGDREGAAFHICECFRQLNLAIRKAQDLHDALIYIDLILLRARLFLLNGNPVAASSGVKTSIESGNTPSAEAVRFCFLAATDPDCEYAWGIAEGRHLLAESLLLEAAQTLGRREFDPKRLDSLPVDVRNLVTAAREQLALALEQWRALRDPESNADINLQGERTTRVMEQVDRGVLTEYSLEMACQEISLDPLDDIVPDRGGKFMPKKHVFLSYCRDNKTVVTKLHDELVAEGERVWWDQDIIGGQDWKLEIRKAMRDAYAVVLCLSTETADRIASGIYPEVLDAIEAYRQYSPGTIFLIPVRLSDCGIPLIEIDATRTLDRLEFVDLFPPSRRGPGFAKLVKALQTAPRRP